MKGYLFLILLIVRVSCYSQDRNYEPSDKSLRIIDSLNKLIGHAKPEEKFEFEYDLFREFLSVNPDSAFVHISRASDEALIRGDSLNIVKSYNGIAWISRNRGDVQYSIELSEKALCIAKNNKIVEQEKFLLNNLALLNTEVGAYDKGLYYNFESLRLREREGTPLDISIAINNIGYIYQRLDDFENALTYYERRYQILFNNKSYPGLDHALVNVAYMQGKLGRYEESELNFARVFLMCDSLCSSNVRIVLNMNYGQILVEEGKYNAAEKYFETTDSLISQYSMGATGQAATMEYRSSIDYWLAVVKYHLHDMKQSIIHLEKSQSISIKSGFKHRMAANHLLLSKIYGDMHNYEESLYALREYLDLKDELMNSQVLNRISALKLMNAEDENLAKIESQRKILKLNFWLNIAAGAIILLVLILALALARAVIKKQKTNELLDLRVRERTHDLEMSRDEFRHANDEKIFVLKNVHQGLQSSLATLRGLSLIARNDTPGEQDKYFVEFESVTEKMADHVKQYIPQATTEA